MTTSSNRSISVGKILIIGLGSAIVGVFSNSFQTVFKFPSVEHFAAVSELEFSFLATLVTALGLFFMAFLAAKKPAIIKHLPQASLALMGISLLLLALSISFTPAIYLAVLLAGFGLAFGFGFWMVASVSFGFKNAIIILVTFRLLSGIGAYILRATMPMDIWFTILAILFLVLCIITMNYAASPAWTEQLAALGQAKVTGEEFVEESLVSVKSQVMNLKESIVYVSLFAFASGALRTLPLGEDVSIYNGIVLGATILGVALSFIFLLKTKREMLQSLIRVVMMLSLASAYLLFPFVPEGLRIYLFGAGDALYVAATMYMNYAVAKAAVDKPLSALVSLGVFKGFVFASVSAGLVLTNALPFLFEQETAALTTLSLVAVYIIAIASFSSSFGKKEAKPVVVDISNQQLKANAALAKQYGLSDREVDVLSLLMVGNSVSSIAEALYISENTVKTHLKHIYGKCGVHNKNQLRTAIIDYLANE